MLGPTKFTSHVINTNLETAGLTVEQLTDQQWAELAEYIADQMQQGNVNIRPEKRAKMGEGTEDYYKGCLAYAKKLISEYKHKYYKKKAEVEGYVKPQEQKPEIAPVIFADQANHGISPEVVDALITQNEEAADVQ